MILINYIKQDVVITSSKLITGEVVVRDRSDRVLVRHTFREESMINLKVVAGGDKWIRVTVTTGGSSVVKSFQINN